MNEQQLMSMKKKLDELQRLKDKAKWEFEAAEKELQSLGVKTPEAALKLAEIKISEAKKLEEQMNKVWNDTQEKFKSLLEMVR